MTYIYDELKGELSIDEYNKLEEALNDPKIAEMFGINIMLKKPIVHTYHCHTIARDVTLAFDKENGIWHYKIGGSIESILIARHNIGDILEKSDRRVGA